MAFDATDRFPAEDLRASLRIALEMDQLRDGRQRLRITAPRQGQPSGRFGLQVRPANIVEFRTGRQLHLLRQILFPGEFEQQRRAAVDLRQSANGLFAQCEVAG